MLPLFSEPPTKASLDEARNLLHATDTTLDDLTTKIDRAELALAELIRDSQHAINEMQLERRKLEEEVMLTRAYLSPIRRLPAELLRDVFRCYFDEYPCCAWVLAAVCTTWRHVALKTPKIWSKIRIVTTQHASADTIRLWLERSGDTVPLDIEIFLRVTGSEAPSIRRSRLEDSPPPSPNPWGFAPPPQGTISYIPPHTSLPPAILPPSAPLIVSYSAPAHDPWGHSPAPETRHVSQPLSRSVDHWGHIAIYYLVEQMHRWKRFIFRYDRSFSSVNALKSITGDAPLLEEFEISSGEAGFYPEWQWLPNAPPGATPVLARLHTLTLQYAPFKWSSPLLRTNLRVLNLRALPSTNLPLDRVMYIITNNPALEDVTLNFVATSQPVLPLTTTTLADTRRFHIGGHHNFITLLDFLVLPKLEDLGVDMDGRDLDSTIMNLLERSGRPPIEHLSIGYSESVTSPPIFYGPSMMISWQTLLGDLCHLKTLCVGGTPLEPLMTALDAPDDDSIHTDSWLCPKLETLALRNCLAPTIESEGVGRIIKMVNARNPASGGALSLGGVVPSRLGCLKLYNCTSLGEDIVDWLKGRIHEVVWSGLEYDR